MQSLPAETILIVECQNARLEELEADLTREGFHTVRARSGTEGMAYARSRHPNLIVLDVRYPDDANYEFWQRLSACGETARIPVVVLNCMQRPDVIRRATLGAPQYLVRKPHDAASLGVLIRHALANGGAGLQPAR